MIAEASTLLDQLVGVYRPYVRHVAGEHGWDTVEGLDDAIDAGAAWLETALEELLAQHFDAQRRGPLEVLQEAMRFPSAALAAAGIPEVPRQATATRALPGDVYDLAPESSRLLGEDVWYAHLAWGAAKARVLTARRVAVLSLNLMDVSRIESAASAAHMTYARWGVGDLGSISLVCVDLEAPGALDVVAEAAGAGVRVVAYAPHRAVALLKDARSLGADAAMPRSQFFRRLTEVLGDWTGTE